MTALIKPMPVEDEFVALVTDIAYRALLRQGLRGSFMDVELDLWKQIRSAYREQRDRRFDGASVIAEAR